MCRRAAPAEAGYPTMVYSYSSRAHTDLQAIYADTYDCNPRPVVSLYDARHHVDVAAVEGASSHRPVRFLDSGMFEVGITNEPWVLAGPPGTRRWTRDDYVATARAVARPGDMLVSFDTRDPIAEQVRAGCASLDEAAPVGVGRDLLIHVEEAAPAAVAEEVAQVASGVDALGVTEKEIGLPWFVGAAYLRDLRRELGRRLDRYLPIHVFGCLDPRTVPLLFLAGADVFDGLAWLRYYFRDGHAFYQREFEHDAPPAMLADWRSYVRGLAANNIGVMERLAADLRYAVLAEDGELVSTYTAALADALPEEDGT